MELGSLMLADVLLVVGWFMTFYAGVAVGWIGCSLCVMSKWALDEHDEQGEKAGQGKVDS
jgi:hypothetical protein